MMVPRDGHLDIVKFRQNTHTLAVLYTTLLTNDLAWVLVIDTYSFSSRVHNNDLCLAEQFINEAPDSQSEPMVVAGVRCDGREISKRNRIYALNFVAMSSISPPLLVYSIVSK